MTILVGMVGLDGIILAADQKLVDPAEDDKDLDDCSDILKIRHLGRQKIVYAGAGDYIPWQVGRHLGDPGFDFGAVSDSLQTLAEQTITAEKRKYTPNNFPEGIRRSLLVAFYGDQLPEPQLWSVKILAPPFDCVVDRIRGIAFEGALGNRARFFGHYFKPAPISKLKLLAAHIVLTAAQFDSGMIGGLDLATIDGAGCRLADEIEKQSLREKSEKLDRSIRDHLFGE